MNLILFSSSRNIFIFVVMDKCVCFSVILGIQVWHFQFKHFRQIIVFEFFFIDWLGKVLDFSTLFLLLQGIDHVSLIHCLSIEKHTGSPFPLNLEGTPFVFLLWNFKFCPATMHVEFEGQGHILKNIELLLHLFLYVLISRTVCPDTWPQITQILYEYLRMGSPGLSSVLKQ